MRHLVSVESKVCLHYYGCGFWDKIGVRAVKDVIVELINDLLLFAPPEISALKVIVTESVTGVAV